jgi:hypothetical protein
MKHALILSLCFLPLAVIYIVMKVSLWLSTSVSEVNYVREDAKREHGPYLEDPYGDVDEKEEDY